MTVGSYEAKTYLAELLERVANGEEVTITKHGVPVAVLVPPTPSGKKPTKQVLEEARQLGDRIRERGGAATAQELLEWKEEGRS